MDLDIIKIAADTSNNKILEDYTHKSKYKNKTCGDYIEIRLEIKKNQIKNIGYQTKSCVYCQASTNLVTKNLIKKTKNKLNYLLDNLVDYFEDEIKPLPKDLIKFKKLFNKKNISRKNCVIMPLIALKKMSINE
jgi:nitrogen fixation NifU-like protein